MMKRKIRNLWNIRSRQCTAILLLLVTLLCTGCEKEEPEEIRSLPTPWAEEQVLYSDKGVTITFLEITEEPLTTTVWDSKTGEPRELDSGNGKFFHFEIRNDTGGTLTVCPTYFAVNRARIKNLYAQTNRTLWYHTEIAPHTVETVMIGAEDLELQLSYVDAIREFSVRFQIVNSLDTQYVVRTPPTITELIRIETDAADGKADRMPEGMLLSSDDSGMHMYMEPRIHHILRPHHAEASLIFQVWVENESNSELSVSLSGWDVNEMYAEQEYRDIKLLPGDRVSLSLELTPYKMKVLGITSVDTISFFFGHRPDMWEDVIYDSASFTVNEDILTRVIEIPSGVE